MKKYNIKKSMILFCSTLALLVSTVQITLGFIMTKTDTLVSVFTPIETIVNNLFISKKVEHPFGENYKIPDSITFDFKVNLGSTYAGSKINTTNGEKVADENGVITVSIKPGTSVGIEGIEEGTKVSVTEILKDGSGFSVKNGILTKEATISSDSNVLVDFINVYTPAKVNLANINVSGTVDLEGRKWKEGDKFEFELLQSNGKDNWKSISKKIVTYDASNKNFNKFDFSDVVNTLQFNKAGTYSFRISQVSGNILGIAYDKNINEFNVVVNDKDMDGKLEIQKVTSIGNTTVTKDENSNKYNISTNFKNKFEISNIEQIEDIEVSVNIGFGNIIGSSTTIPEGFEFKLVNKDTGEVLIATVGADGIVRFGLRFTAQDIGNVYNYRLMYGNEVHDIQITIDLNEKGELESIVEFDGQEIKEDTIIEVEDIYIPEIEDTNPPSDTEDNEDKPSNDSNDNNKPSDDAIENEDNKPSNDSIENDEEDSSNDTVDNNVNRPSNNGTNNEKDETLSGNTNPEEDNTSNDTDDNEDEPSVDIEPENEVKPSQASSNNKAIIYGFIIAIIIIIYIVFRMMTRKKDEN